MKLNTSCQTIQRQIRRKIPTNNIDISPKRTAYYIHILKNKKIISDNMLSYRSRNDYKNKCNLLINNKTNSLSSVSFNSKSRNTKRKILPKIYSYKYFHKQRNKNLLHKSTNNVNSIENNKTNMESNFMSLLKESNIYTSKVKYISNIKMLLLDKYKFDNDTYRPDRLKIYDMSKLPKPKFKLKKFNFRNFFFNHKPIIQNNCDID